jgi:hypothetical protein
MKTIERQIRNHEFEMQLHPASETEPNKYVADERYFVDGQRCHREAFIAAIALLSAEAPK